MSNVSMIGRANVISFVHSIIMTVNDTVKASTTVKLRIMSLSKPR